MVRGGERGRGCVGVRRRGTVREEGRDLDRGLKVEEEDEDEE